MERTIKQWHAEKARERLSKLERLASVKLPYLADNQKDMRQIMELLTETLSDRQLKLLQHLGERYGSATQETAARMLSGYIAGMTAGQSIADRTQTFATIFQNSLQWGVTDAIDRMQLHAFLATVAHGGALDFRVVQSSKGDYAVRVKPRHL